MCWYMVAAGPALPFAILWDFHSAFWFLHHCTALQSFSTFLEEKHNMHLEIFKERIDVALRGIGGVGLMVELDVLGGLFQL